MVRKRRARGGRAERGEAAERVDRPPSGKRRGGGGGRPGPGSRAPAGPAGAERIFSDVSYWDARIIQVATVLDVFTLLADGPATAEDVAVRLATDKRATELLLNALTEIGYLIKKNDRFSNAPHAQAHLVRGQKGYIGWTVLMEARSWGLWGTLEESIRTGKQPEGPKLYGDDEERTRILLQSLHARAEALFTRHMVEKVRLEGITTLLDLGGGLGSYAVAFARRWPKLNVTLYDLPHVIEQAKETIGKTDVHKRLQLQSGDYRKDPLAGPYDVAFLSNIVHTEGESDAKALVKKVFDSLNPGGRVVLRDMFPAPDRAGPRGAVFSINMLLNTESGRCYSAPEVEAMLKEAGFADVRMTEPFTLIEARKPGKLPSEEKPPEKSEEKPTEETPEKPAKKPAENSAEKPAEESEEKPAEQPSEKPAENPTENPTEKPAEESKEKSGRESPEKRLEEAPPEATSESPPVKSSDESGEKPS